MIKKCTADNKHPSVAECAKEDEINAFINDVIMVEESVTDFINFELHGDE